MPGPDGRLSVALVGANASGSGWEPVAHMPAIAAVEQPDLVALCISSPTSAAAAAEAYGIPRAYHDVHELAAQSDIDLVTVAVKAPHHHSIVMPLPEARTNVYREWPLGAGLRPCARGTPVVEVIHITRGLKTAMQPDDGLTELQGHVLTALTASMTG